MSQPISTLSKLGQSVWYDYIRRDLLGPNLEALIERGLRGMTSNPTIFEKAISQTDLYDEDIRNLGPHASPEAVLEDLMVADIQKAADLFMPVNESTGKKDGFVSIEVDPRLARDTQGSIEAARRLSKKCDRPNVMVKIPGTAEGLPAIFRCLAEGININITLLFSVERYEQVIEAYMSAIEERLESGQSIDETHSVASFFVSRVDTNADRRLDAISNDEKRSESDRNLARKLRGKIAIANAKLAYGLFERMFCNSERFSRLTEEGAQVQRPLWASTSTKDPAYPELYYVESLIAPATVDTMPPKTFQSYLSHGDPKVRIYDDMEEARAAVEDLSSLGIDLAAITQELEDEGVEKFEKSYDAAIQAVRGKQSELGVSGEQPKAP